VDLARINSRIVAALNFTQERFLYYNMQPVLIPVPHKLNMSDFYSTQANGKFDL